MFLTEFFDDLKVELSAMGGFGAAMYCGTGCFHRRVSLCGSKYSEENKGLWNLETRNNDKRTVIELEEASKVLASCGYEKGTQWGKEVYISCSDPCFCCFFFLMNLTCETDHFNGSEDGTNIWVSSRRHSYRLDNPMQGMEISLSQSR